MHYRRPSLTVPTAPHPLGYKLATAEILYWMPDHPDILQTYVWQALDLAPRYPALHKFLDFWERELDGKLHSVRVASAGVLGAPRFRSPGALLEDRFVRIH